MALFAKGKQAQGRTDHLVDLEHKMQAISRSQAVIEFKLDGTVIEANDNFLRTMGYAMDEVRGAHHRMFVDASEVQSEDYRAFWRQLNEGRFVAGKFRRRDKSGRDVWLQATYNPILDDQGRAYKVIKFAVNITEAEQLAERRESERVDAEAAQARLVELLAGSLSRLARGDLTTTIEAALSGAHEQVKTDFNGAVASLRETMGAIAAATSGVGAGADEIAGASGDLSRRTEQQAASLEETAAALDEITATVKRSSEGARQASGAASDARAEAERSGVVVEEAVAAMSEIEQSASKIGNIIGVIDEIAFQTNLLALNAGVEAARAGEAGRGFAVVAQEVRALAQRSAEAAKEIKALISASSAHVAHGVTLVGATGEALNGIRAKVSQIDQLISEIAVSSQEQATGLSEVNTTMNHMDQVTQQNAAMVEEATAASGRLKEAAAELQRLVAQFQTGESAARAPVEAARPSRHAPVRSPAQRAQQRVQAAFGGRAAASDGWEES